MEFKYTLQKTLEARFTDRDEMEDIANYGADTGVSGFTYTYEINEFFNEFENEIENYYYEVFDNNYIHELSDGITSFDELRAKMVWGLIEMWCADAVDSYEELTAA